MKGAYKTIQVNEAAYETLMKRLIGGCGKCQFEEADGGLYCHCAECRLAITGMAYELFTDSTAARKFAETTLRASMGEEPVSSPSVDRSEKDRVAITIELRVDTEQFQKDLRRLADAAERRLTPHDKCPR